MRIAQIAPIAERVPPKKYGGTERVVSALTEELVARGHEVTLFASGDSVTSANLKSVFPKGTRESRVQDPHGLNPWNQLNIGYAYSLQDQFDIIHDHNGVTSLPLANIATTPSVFTIHSPFLPAYQVLFQSLQRPYLVSISRSQAKNSSLMNFMGTVHNGLSFANYPFNSRDEGFLLFVGRISMEKGVHHAIETAEALGLPLTLAAKVDDVDRVYFSKYIKPRLNKKIKWVGEVDEKERNRLYSKALAFLHPVTWPEPFGLTLIEAMACGCPVVAFDNGSIPELVVNGQTGFVVKSTKEMIESILKIDTIDRVETRKHAQLNFNSQRMADGYEAIYRQILSLEKKQITYPGQGLGFLLGSSLPNGKKSGNRGGDPRFRKS